MEEDYRSDNGLFGKMGFECSSEFARQEFVVDGRNRDFHFPYGHIDLFTRQFNLNLEQDCVAVMERHVAGLDGTG
jgi:hypothetical protein